MTNTATSAAAAPAPLSLGARVIGILTAPRKTYESVVANPTWFGMLAFCTVAAMVLVGGFLFTQVGQDAWLQTVTTARQMNEQQLQAMEKVAPYAGYFALGQMLVFVPIVTVVMAGILFAIFNAALGGDASFKQVFSVVTHAGPVGVVGQLFAMPLNYYRGTMTSAANLGVLFPMLDENSFANHLLGAIDLFVVWQVIVLSIGLAVLYRRKTQPIAIGLLVFYAVVALIIAVVKSR